VERNGRGLINYEEQAFSCTKQERQTNQKPYRLSQPAQTRCTNLQVIFAVFLAQMAFPIAVPIHNHITYSHSILRKINST